MRYSNRIHSEELDKNGWKGGLNNKFRKGGNPVEDREYHRDCVTEMEMAQSHPYVLRNKLEEMGIGFEGDEPINWTEE